MFGFFVVVLLTCVYECLGFLYALHHLSGTVQGVGVTGTRVTGDCKPPCGYWESNLADLEDWPVLTTGAIFLVPLVLLQNLNLVSLLFLPSSLWFLQVFDLKLRSKEIYTICLVLPSTSQQKSFSIPSPSDVPLLLMKPKESFFMAHFSKPALSCSFSLSSLFLLLFPSQFSALAGSISPAFLLLIFLSS